MQKMQKTKLGVFINNQLKNVRTKSINMNNNNVRMILIQNVKEN